MLGSTAPSQNAEMLGTIPAEDAAVGRRRRATMPAGDASSRRPAPLVDLPEPVVEEKKPLSYAQVAKAPSTPSYAEKACQYLPFQIRGFPVLLRKADGYLVANSLLKSELVGLTVRSSKNIDDKGERIINYGSTVDGIVEQSQDGVKWLKITTEASAAKPSTPASSMRASGSSPAIGQYAQTPRASAAKPSTPAFSMRASGSSPAIGCKGQNATGSEAVKNQYADDWKEVLPGVWQRVGAEASISARCIPDLFPPSAESASTSASSSTSGATYPERRPQRHSVAHVSSDSWKSHDSWKAQESWGQSAAWKPSLAAVKQLESAAPVNRSQNWQRDGRTDDGSWQSNGWWQNGDNAQWKHSSRGYGYNR